MFLFSVSQLNIVKKLRYLGCMLSIQEGMFWLGYWWTFSAFPLCHSYVICCIEIWRLIRWNSNNISEKYYICLDTFLGSPFFVHNWSNCFYSQAEWPFPSDRLHSQGRLTGEAVAAVRAAGGSGVRWIRMRQGFIACLIECFPAMVHLQLALCCYLLLAQKVVSVVSNVARFLCWLSPELKSKS